MPLRSPLSRAVKRVAPVLDANNEERRPEVHTALSCVLFSVCNIMKDALLIIVATSTEISRF